MRLEGYKSAIFEEVRLGGFSANPATAPGFLFMALRWSRRLVQGCTYPFEPRHVPGLFFSWAYFSQSRRKFFLVVGAGIQRSCGLDNLS